MSRLLFFPLASSVLIALAVFPAPAPAQSQDAPSIADAARRSRDQKKNAAKASKIVTDDDISPKDVKPGEQGLTLDAPPKLETQPPSASDVAAAGAASSTSAPANPDAAAKSRVDAELAQLKAQLAQAQKELDLDQRELALDQDTHLSIPDYQHDTAGQAKVDADKRQVDDKQQAVDRLKTRVAALQELKAREKPAAPAPAANPPAPPQP